ncbi:putative transcription factor C2H2 family [Lupinus albus]|uniref:Putative transcription factor C2H2 family n=1 Tax=Lupinus albus TaxID=3870 RepID=A0A6A4NL42_LUPAL|nr:putative transcription factor C2H2 family [Lupinus albus]
MVRDNLGSTKKLTAMESSYRPLNSSREQRCLKKPRLVEHASNNSILRPVPQKQMPSSDITTLSFATRFRTNDRDLESSDFDRGHGGYHPQPPVTQQELVHQYNTALAELTFNSKPIITNLTIIAGENQTAAKTIAATVCAHIIEVPSEQKLPSLYLLDSIVKNIGRDYIKYFGSRLPEVFCKAYRYVDPSVRQSMRHLFGTWRGVFPPQTLQTIEKELGFAPAVNSSASASATLRSDSQSHPLQSIHVNPKYLERKHLQQSSRSKGVVDDMTGAISYSNEDPERADRASGAARPWVNPSLNMHLYENNQHSHRNASNDPVPEKSIGASYGGNEYGSDLSRNLGSGMGRTGGRVTESGHDRSWFKAGGVAGTTSVKRNGFSLKRNFSKIEEDLQPTQHMPSIQNSLISSSWKHSEEEEYMWDDMNFGLAGHGAPKFTNNGSKDPWTDNDENLEVEDHLQIQNPFQANVDMEVPTESLAIERRQLLAFKRHPSLSLQMQEQHSIDELNQKPHQSEGFASTLGGLTGNTISSAARIGNRPFLPNATIGLAGTVGQRFHPLGAGSSSRQSPLQQESPSPPVSAHHHPHQMQDLAEQDHPQTHKTSKFLGGLQNQYIKDSLPSLPPIDQDCNLRSSQQKKLQAPFCLTKSFQPRHPLLLGSSHTEVMAKTEKPPMSKVSLSRKTPERSTTSSLEAATVKSAIFSIMPITSSLPTTSSLDTRNPPSKLGVRSSWAGGPSPTTLISSVSAIISPSSLGPHNDYSSALPKVPLQKAGQPSRVSTLQPASSNISSISTQTVSATNNTANPIANLLSSLIAKGMITAETESPAKVPSEMLSRLEDQSKSITTSSSLPVASVSGSAALPTPTQDMVDDTAKTPISLSESASTEIRDFIGFEFKPRLIRELHPPVIKGLFDDLPHQCGVCGLRLKFQEEFNRHLEWHATREREQNSSRRWYPKSSDWVIGKADGPSEHDCSDYVDTYSKENDSCQEDVMVPGDEKQCLCVFCGELFEDFYSQENDEWMFKGAIYMTNSDSNSDLGIGKASTASGPIIHARCVSENIISNNNIKNEHE